MATKALEPGLLSFTAEAGHEYEFTRTGSLSLDMPASVNAGQQFKVTANVGALSAPVAAGSLRLNLPEGWIAAPGVTSTPVVPVGTTGKVESTVWPTAAARGDSAVSAILATGGTELSANGNISVA